VEAFLVDRTLAGRVNELEQPSAPITDADIDALPAYGQPATLARVPDALKVL
jgi:hypothetical protein